MMHESPLICPLLKITPKAIPSTDPSTTEMNSADDETTSSGIALGKFRHQSFKRQSFQSVLSPTGYMVVVAVVILAFVAFYFVIRNPERREIIRNLIKFKSRSTRVQYSRVS